MEQIIDKFIILLILNNLVFCNLWFAQLPPKPDKAFTVWMEKTMQQYHVPAVSIAVVKHYHLEWSGAFSLANIAAQQTVTPATLFQAGSISKPVTAMAALKAVQDGKLSLDKNINQYLTSWKIPENQFTQSAPVTLRRLLDHSAGISVHGFLGYAKGKKLPSLIDVLNGTPPANSSAVRVVATPGTQFSYSGGGYTVIQQALMDVYRQSFAQILSRLVLKPLDMTSSTFQQPLPEQLLARAAMPYLNDSKPVARGPHTYVEKAAAGLWTTPADLAKFIISVQQSLIGDINKVLAANVAKLMVTPAIDQNMGLGFEISVNKYGKPATNGAYFMHLGENQGYRDVVLASLQNGNGLIIMSNMSEDNDLILQHKIVENWSFMDVVIKRIADSENWE